MWAGRVEVSASYNVPASPYLPDSSSKPVHSSRFLQALECRAPIRSLVESLDGADLAAAKACCAQVRARVEAEELPADVLDEISSAYRDLMRQRRANTGRCALIGDD